MADPWPKPPWPCCAGPNSCPHTQAAEVRLPAAPSGRLSDRCEACHATYRGDDLGEYLQWSRKHRHGGASDA